MIGLSFLAFSLRSGVGSGAIKFALEADKEWAVI